MNNQDSDIRSLLESGMPDEALMDFLNSSDNDRIEPVHEQKADIMSSETDVAVIGMSCRFADASDADEFWENLLHGKCSIREISRWKESEYYSADKNAQDRSYSKWGAFIDDIYGFDAEHFNLNPREAELMDPQQRFALMESWRALDDAGYSSCLSGLRCGIYVGVADGNYDRTIDEPMSAYRYTGNNRAIASGRLAYIYDTKGPAVTVDTACSSSLTALHMAYSSLILDEVEIALAGGVTLYVTPDMYIGTSKCGMLSDTGACRAFDRDANGFVPGEGCGFLVLKKLSAAVRDKDHIYAVIKGSYLNQDGRTNGITSPNVFSQHMLQSELFSRYHIDPNKITYVEAHGTGTKLGDPIELEALTKSFRAYTDRSGYCAVGSVKTNIGHTVAAAGIASIIKCILMMQHGKIVSTLGCDNINPLMEIDKSPFYIATECSDWNAEKKMALINSFGFSGTNASAILESYETTEPYEPDDSLQEVRISAGSDQSLRNLMKKYLSADQLEDIAAIAYTASIKPVFEHTAVFYVRDTADLKEQLRISLTSEAKNFLSDRVFSINPDRSRRKVQLPYYCFDMKQYGSVKCEADKPYLYEEVYESCSALPDITDAYSDRSVCLIGAPLTWEAFFNSTRSVCTAGWKVDELMPADDYILYNSVVSDDIDTIAYMRMYFAVIQRILQLNPMKKLRIVSVNVQTGYGSTPMLEALDSFERQIAAEAPQTVFFSVSAAVGIRDEQLCRLIGRELQFGNTSVYYDTKLNRHSLSRKMFQAASTRPGVLRDGCNYVITGGSGGIGRVLLKHFCSQYDSQFIVIGRSEYDERIAAIINSADPSGRKILYVQGDISDPVQAEQIAENIRQKVGSINGIIHSAGIFRNDYLLHKELDDAELVIRTKVNGLYNLEHYFMDDDTDFLVAFSSLASIIGKEGQADYVYANRFIDCFIRSKSMKDALTTKKARYYVFNWPYWLNGGMQLDADDTADLKSRYGLEPMTDECGIGAFEAVMNSPKWNAVVFSGDRVQFEKALKSSESKENKYLSIADPEEMVLSVLKELTGNHGITTATELPSLNIDSLLVNSFNGRIEKEYPSIPRTILYECKTVGEICHVIRSILHDCEETSVHMVRSAPIADENSDIAIIGLSGYYPDSDDLETFWKNIRNGVCSIKGLPFNRWHRHSTEMEIYSDRIYCKKGAFLDDVNSFDCKLFNISPKTAINIDPQERKILETALNAFWDSGYSKQSLSRFRIGVFIGSTTNSYIASSAEQWRNGSFSGAASRPWSIANRISYYFDFNGQSIGIDTACSSGLSALYYACQSILSGDCEIALAGGVNIYVHPEKYLALCDNKMLSVSGKSSPFGADADGFVPGEGAGCVVLKKLQQAEADGDRIYGVIKAVEMNHGGFSNGYYVPNIRAQEDIIRSCIDRSGLTKEDITYLESHGTGTSLGDPIELAALCHVFGKNASPEKKCHIGSVKANIGHLESAAGIASLTKVLFMLRDGLIPPMLNCSVLNPKLDLENCYFGFPQVLTEWKPTENGVRAAGLSSFGAGGVNVHAIVTSYVSAKSAEMPEETVMIPLTAMSITALKKWAEVLKQFITDNCDDSDFGNIVRTMQRGCMNLAKRVLIATDSLAGFKHALAEIAEGCHTEQCIFGNTENVNTKFDAWLKGRIGFPQDIIRNGSIMSLPGYPFEREQFDLSEFLAPPCGLIEENLSRLGMAEYAINHVSRLPVLNLNGVEYFNNVFAMEALTELFGRCRNAERAYAFDIVSAAPFGTDVRRCLIRSSDGISGDVLFDVNGSERRAAKANYQPAGAGLRTTFPAVGMIPILFGQEAMCSAVSDDNRRYFCFKFEGSFSITKLISDSISTVLSNIFGSRMQWAFSRAERAFLDKTVSKHNTVKIIVLESGRELLMAIEVLDENGQLAFSADKVRIICFEGGE